MPDIAKDSNGYKSDAWQLVGFTGWIRAGACVMCVAKPAAPCKISAKPYTRTFV